MRLIYEPLTDIPSTFTEVEYIESTGTQWIDTGINAKSTLKTDIHFEIVDKTQGGHIFGGRTVTSGGRGYGVYLPTSGGIGFDYETRLTSNVSTTNGYKYRIVKDGASNTLYVNGVQSYNGNNTEATFNLNVTMALFYMKDSNTSFNTSVKCKVFYFKIYDNGVLVRDFVPCLDASNVPCMWDKVSGQTFYNQGTGSFTYGHTITPVEYLESTGTQYIDTGIKGKSGISAKTKVNYTDLSGTGSHAIGGEYTTNTSCYFGMVRANGHFTYLYKNSVIETTTTISTNTDYDFDITLNNGNQEFVINGNVVSTGTVSGDFTSTNNLFLYAINSVNGADVFGLLKMYYMQIWDNGSFVRDYIPCKDENGVGFMFDKVSHTIYLNAGTGSFVVGKTLPKKKLRLIKDSKRRVPKGFTEVEYLQSNGTEWIDVGTNVNTATDEIELYFQITDSANYKWIFGQHDDNARLGLGTGDGSNKRNVAYGNSTYKVNDTEMYNSQHYYKVDSTGVYLNNVKIANYANFSSTSTLYLFNLNLSSATYMCKGKIWAYRHKRNGVLIRDMIPCLDTNNVPCMYDVVEQKAYYNAGTGTFNYGNQIIPVKYIESTGTQYINTGIKLTANHSVEVDYQLTVASQLRKGLYGGLVANGARHGALLSPSNAYLEAGYGATNVYYQLGLPNTNRHVLKQEKNNLYFDNTLVYTFETATFTQDFTAPLGNFNYTNYNPASAKYYSSKWWDGNTLVRDFIPVKDENNVGYLLDIVSHTLYSNVGTGSFVVGEELKDITRFIMD